MNKLYFKQNGFTLFEIMITLAISAILAAIAIPYMGNSIAKAHANDVATAIYNGLNRAKSGVISSQSVGLFAPQSTCNFAGTLGASRAGVYTFDHPYKVNCSVSGLTSVYFRPDGSVTQANTSLSPLSAPMVFTVTGGYATFVVSLNPSGLITKVQQ